MNNNKHLSPKESLEIITDAINSTRENVKEYSYSFSFWGWLVILGCLSNYYLANFTTTKNTFLPWIVLMPLGWLIMRIKHKKQTKNEGYETYSDSFIKNLWIVIGIALFVGIYISIVLQIKPTIFVLIITGIGTLTTGLLIKFKPLIYGGVFFFIFAILSVFIEGSYVLLINALAIFVGYLIPAYLLKKS